MGGIPQAPNVGSCTRALPNPILSPGLVGLLQQHWPQLGPGHSGQGELGPLLTGVPWRRPKAEP